MALTKVTSGTLADDAVTSDKLSGSINITTGNSLTIDSGATIDVTNATKTGFPQGGLKFVTSSDLTSVVSTWDFLQCFTSSYTNYLILISGLCVDTNATDLYVKFGNADLSSTTTAGREQYMISADAGTTSSAGSTVSDGMRLTSGQNNGNTIGFSGHIWVYSPYPSGQTTYATGQGQFYSDTFTNSYVYTDYGWFGGSQIESIRFISSSGNIGDTGATARVTIYGLAES